MLLDRQLFSVFNFWISFSSTNLGHCWEEAIWSPLQFLHFGDFWQLLPSCSSSSHLKQVSQPLHVDFPLPNRWHLKQRSGFGMNMSIFIWYNPTLMFICSVQHQHSLSTGTYSFHPGSPREKNRYNIVCNFRCNMTGNGAT